MAQNKELEDLQGEVEKHKKCIGKHESYINSIIMAYVEKHREFEIGEEVLFNDTTAKVIGFAAYYPDKLFFVTGRDYSSNFSEVFKKAIPKIVPSDYKFDIINGTSGQKLLEYEGMGAWYLLRKRKFYNGPIPAKFSDLINEENYESNLDFEKKIWISPSHYVLKDGRIPVEHVVIDRLKKKFQCD